MKNKTIKISMLNSTAGAALNYGDPEAPISGAPAITKDGEAVTAPGFCVCRGNMGTKREHAPITFMGSFRALCPLCALCAAVESAEVAAEERAAEAIDCAEDAQRMAERSRDNIVEQRDALAQSVADVLPMLRTAAQHEKESGRHALDLAKLADKLQQDAETVGRMPE